MNNIERNFYYIKIYFNIIYEIYTFSHLKRPLKKIEMKIFIKTINKYYDFNMDEFFNNKNFINLVDKLPYGKVRTVEIMKEIKEKNPELSIQVFICILHKRTDPAISYMGMGAALYMTSVNLWDDYIFHNHKCDYVLLINHNNICY
jgi:hypothetical protein